MIRYRAWLFAAALMGGLAFLYTWRAADVAPGVLPAGDGLAVPLDDAAIYFQYVRQALHGDWLRYSPGAAVSTGVTSPLYFLLLVAGMGLGLSGPFWAWLIGLGSLVIGLVAADRLARRLFPALPPWWAGFLLLSQGAWVAAHFNGMETGLFLALSWAALDAVSDPGASTRVLPILAALAFTRPEGQVMSVVLGGAWAWQRRSWLSGSLVLAAAAAPTLLLLLVSGSIVPDSVRPKSAALSHGKDLLELAGRASAYLVAVIKGAWMGFWGGADEVGQAGNEVSRNPISTQFPPLALLAAILGLAYQQARSRKAFWLSAAACLALVPLLLSWNLPVGWHSHRYLAAATPLLLLAMLAGLDAMAQDKAALIRTLGLSLFILWTGFGLASWPWHLFRCYDGALSYAAVNRNAAVALRDVEAGPVAVVDSGLLAYYSGHTVVDLPGITDHALAMAQAQGRGAIVEAMLDRAEAPRWAALHLGRPDFDPTAYMQLGMLKSLRDLAPGFRLYAWDFSGAAEARKPAYLPKGWRILGQANIADLASEAACGARFQGDDAWHTRLARLHISPRGPQAPEGGRRLDTLTLRPSPGATVALLRVVINTGGTLGAGALSVPAPPSPSECYSEVGVPLPPGANDVTFHYQAKAGAATDWAVYRVWFLKEGAD